MAKKGTPEYDAWLAKYKAAKEGTTVTNSYTAPPANFMTFEEHDFEKSNLMTLTSKRGAYDIYKCKKCGASGKRYGIGSIHIIPDKYKPACTEAVKADKIRITKCNAQGKSFANLTPGSEHLVVKAPEPYKDDFKGVWVMGVGEPVKILNDEFSIIK